MFTSGREEPVADEAVAEGRQAGDPVSAGDSAGRDPSEKPNGRGAEQTQGRQRRHREVRRRAYDTAQERLNHERVLVRTRYRVLRSDAFSCGRVLAWTRSR